MEYQCPVIINWIDPARRMSAHSFHRHGALRHSFIDVVDINHLDSRCLKFKLSEDLQGRNDFVLESLQFIGSIFYLPQILTHNFCSKESSLLKFDMFVGIKCYILEYTFELGRTSVFVCYEIHPTELLSLSLPSVMSGHFTVHPHQH